MRLSKARGSSSPRQIDSISTRGVRDEQGCKGVNHAHNNKPGGNMKYQRILAAAFAILLGIAAWSPSSRAADDTIKIGYVDPFSGPFAATGNNFLKVFNYILEIVNAEGG